MATLKTLAQITKMIREGDQEENFNVFVEFRNFFRTNDKCRISLPH